MQITKKDEYTIEVSKPIIKEQEVVIEQHTLESLLARKESILKTKADYLAQVDSDLQDVEDLIIEATALGIKDKPVEILEEVIAKEIAEV